MQRTIKTTELAFDIDGVVADTMEVFIRVAHERYGLTHLRKDDLRHYDLRKCLHVDSKIVDELICMTLDDEHTEQVPPIPDAPDVLTEFASYGALRFITARIWPESIVKWLHNILPKVNPDRIHVIATGDPEAKLDVLRRLGIRYFVEDRLETCRALVQDGIQPLLFDQPWNRGADALEFPRLESWMQLRAWVLPNTGNRK